jgi:hypothetical protein
MLLPGVDHDPDGDGGSAVSLTEFFEYLITHEETADLGSDLVQTYYERVEIVVGEGDGGAGAGPGETAAA